MISRAPRRMRSSSPRPISARPDACFSLLFFMVEGFLCWLRFRLRQSDSQRKPPPPQLMLGGGCTPDSTLAPESNPASCPLTTTYVGRWSWDFKLYMAYAEIVVYRNGIRAGDALYKAPSAGWSMTTEIYEATEQKIEKMVNQLFPNQ